MKRKITYALLLVFLFYLGCKENIDKDWQILDKEKTTQLMTQVINDSTDQFVDSRCISEKHRLLSLISTSDFNNLIRSELEIKNNSHLKAQMELFNNFRVTESLAFGKYIITELEFKKFENQAGKGNHNFWRWLDSNCENGYLSISKPIFNETFDKAILRIGSICGGKCGGGETRIYQFKNNEWTIVKTKFNWIS